MCRSFVATGLIIISAILLSATAIYLINLSPQVEIGEFVSARDLDSSGCPVAETAQFEPSDSLYVVATKSSIPAGTELFVRLSLEGEPVEDSVLLTADQNYNDVCVYMVFEATNEAQEFASGEYSAQLIINGRRGPSVTFQVE